MKNVCVARMTAFGQAGNAGKIRVRTCKQIIAFYSPQRSVKKLARKGVKPQKAAKGKAKKSKR